MIATAPPLPGLMFDAPTHTYTFKGERLLSVTGVLRAAGLVDVAYYTEASRERGTAVHAAIERYHTDPTAALAVDPIATPFVSAYLRFLAESAFRVDASEERLCEPLICVAGTLDLRGEFVDVARGVGESHVDVLDIKTGGVPPWVGVQLAGYVRLLARTAAIRRRCRRWCLQLREDGTYRLLPQRNPTDDAVFVAAVTIAQSKAGWL